MGPAENPVFSFEFFPPKTPEGKATPRTTWQQLAALTPKFFSVTFGAGGTTREGTLETVLEISRRRPFGAPHLSCIASTRARSRRNSRSTGRTASTTSSRCAATCPRAWGIRANCRTRTIWWPSSARPRATGSISRSPAIRNSIRRRAAPPTRSTTSSARSTPGRMARSRSISTTPTPTSVSSMIAAPPASRCRSCPASCRSAIFRSWRASRTPAAPRSRAGCASSSRAITTTWRRSVRSAWTW